MTDRAKQSIRAMRRAHDELVARVDAFDAAQLETPSPCAEWSIADVLSHLGSASEIGLNTLETGKADFATAPAIWDRWNALSAPEKAAGFVEYGGRYVQAYEAQDDEAFEERRIDRGYLPEPVDLGFCADLRLSEMALHGWDVEVPFDPGATLKPYLVPLVLD